MESPHSQFTQAWNGVVQDVLKYCSRQQLNGRPILFEDAKDLTARVAVKVYKNLPTWKRESSFKTWVFAIARNETIDYFRRKQLELARMKELTREADRQQRETDQAAYTANLSTYTANLDAFATNHAALGATGADLPPQEQLKFLLAAVIRTKWPTTNKFYLDDLDLRVLQLKTERPDTPTKKLADYLGLSPANFDVRYCRAQVAIRVYCFLHRPELVGGIQRLTQRFNQLIAKQPPALTPLEEAVFKSMVINSDFNTRPNGWQDALRSACTKMIFSEK
jgi:RNA polymerase sigma factor (sigma-70 family)